MSKPPAPPPDAAAALALSAAGYWVVPLTGYHKSPPKFGDRTHGDILRDGDKTYMDALVQAQQFTATGWSMILQHTDPVLLAVVDVDAYGLALDQAWNMLAGTDPLPDATGIVHSASGGWHFWFRLPDALTAKKLPSTWDFGNGRKGDIRASRDTLQLILLPGSVAKGKHGDRGRYESVGHPLADFSALAPIPPSLLARLIGRGQSEPTPDPGGLPTEATHLLGLLRFISEIPAGEQNPTIAHVGQILGRIGPADHPSADLLNAAWDVVRDRLTTAARDPWTFAAFERAIRGGYKTGRRNREKYGTVNGDPSVTDVKAECEAIFGSVPWLVEIIDSKGVFQEFLLGHGGAPDERDKATSISSIKDKELKHLLAEISRLIPSTDQDALVRSPLFTRPAWGKVLHHMLRHGRQPERLGNDPEARFWELLNEWAVGAAQDGKILDTVSGPWSALNSRQWLVCPAQEEALFCLHADAVERLYARVGDMPTTKRLMALHMRPRALKGRSEKQYTIAVAHLAEETQAQVRRGYEKWIAARREEVNQP